MRTGIDVQAACEQVITEHSERLKKLNITDDNISLIAIDACGKLGAATTKVAFPFVYSNQDQSPVIMVAFSDNGKIKIEKASTTWLAEYKGD
jgi:isoaspartyl peptidase/L-asparaginase-like protein (Ntn-hydrolase superfamily)